MSMDDEEDNKTTPFVRDDEPAPTGNVPAAGSPASSSAAPASSSPASSSAASSSASSPEPKEISPYRQESFPVDKKAGGAMFGNYSTAKKRKAPPWAIPLLTAVAGFHVILFTVMWMKSIWELEMLDKPKNAHSLSLAPPPPPPPPPPPGGAKPQTVQITPKKIKVKDIVQPVKIEKQEQKVVEDSGDPNG
ncbi:MAG TPA: hypothetical protein VGM90_22790, partial [Kofleriaceae bacterium]